MTQDKSEADTGNRIVPGGGDADSVSDADDVDTGDVPIVRDTSDTETGDVPVRPGAERQRFTLAVDADIAGLSHQGKVRNNNEDHYLVARLGRSLHSVMTNIDDRDVPSRFDQDGWLMMVADGMGGAAAGEVASRMAIRKLINLLLEVPDWIMRLDDEAAKKVSERAVTYYKKINAALADAAREEPELQGMGTTMTVAYNLGAEMFVTHAGDSRAYLLHKGNLQQITRDHTQVQDLADAGLINREEAASHHMRHVLTNVLGAHGHDVHVELHRLTVREGDRFLLCTDGLTDMVPDAQIAELLQAGDARTSCRALVDRALENGGADNVTVVVAVYGAPGSR